MNNILKKIHQLFKTENNKVLEMFSFLSLNSVLNKTSKAFHKKPLSHIRNGIFTFLYSQSNLRY